ncbi:MAG: hypothetical protein IJ724_02805, partial [Muribaculaceae bacterium]|nr:hypothetical protein [Muribaculaceae bacterium]
PEDILVFSFTPEGGPTTTDTITILKLDRPHFEAVDCNPTYFHTITQVYTTNHRIASVEIGNPNVDYDDSKAHLLLTLEAADN